MVAGEPMFPGFSEWARWNAVERASYVAQLVTVLSFLSASWFSYQSWREARHAREDQRQFFIEEKSPDVSVLGVQILQMDGGDGSILSVKVRNNGASSAEKLALTAASPLYSPSACEIDPMFREASEASVARGREKDILVAIVRTKETRCPYQLASARLSGSSSASDLEPFIELTLSYEGRFRDRHGEELMIVARRTPK